jgi:hypothetical protein
MDTSFPRAFTLAAIMLSALGGLARADSISFKVALTGEQCVPSVSTAGTGTAELTYERANRTVVWNVTYSGLPDAPTLAHFHGPAGPGKNAKVAIWLVPRGTPPGNPITGQATLTPEQAQEFAEGQWYVNIHSHSHPGCVLRGQVIPPKG